jgi:hypothetical protein
MRRWMHTRGAVECMAFSCVFIKNTIYNNIIIILFFHMYLERSVWTPKRRSAYIHVGVWLVLHGRHTTRISIQLAFWQISDNLILIMFGTIQKLMNCGILTSANAEYINSALSPAALKQAL